MKKIALTISLLFCTFSVLAAGDTILGEWLTGEGKSKVDIQRCGNSFCGKIVWLKEPQYPTDDDQGMAGKDKVDRKNPEFPLRNRSILNLQILSGFQFAGDNEWEDGKIYDPKNGKTYSCILTLKNSKTLNVRGYIGFSLLGRTTVWTRE